jgi:hypothetical protein
MAKVPAFHSKVTLNVHHNNSSCEVGDNIEPRNVVQGTGGLPLCKTCAGLG